MIFVIIVTVVVTIVITVLSPDRRSLLGCLGTFVAQLGRKPVARYLSLSALFGRKFDHDNYGDDDDHLLGNIFTDFSWNLVAHVSRHFTANLRERKINSNTNRFHVSNPSKLKIALTKFTKIFLTKTCLTSFATCRGTFSHTSRAT